jgi:hypothetical protein
MEGGVLYDRGSYGCIYVPPLSCRVENESNHKFKNNRYMLDKIMDREPAEEEFRMASRVSELPLSKNYYVVAEHMCTPKPRDEQDDPQIRSCDLLTKRHITSMRILRMPFGGVGIFDKQFDLSKISVLELFQHLLEAVSILNLHGVIHNDLHGGNILVDENNVTRIIDFNKALFSYEPIDEKELSFMYSASYSQISPDYHLMNGRVQNIGEEFLIKDFLMKRSRTLVNPLRVFFGITEKDIEEQFEQFIEKSKSYKNLNFQSWFSSHWRTLDSWSLGVVFLEIIYSFSFFPSFESGNWQFEKNRVLPVLSKMLAINPFERLDCVQALNELDKSSRNPGNNFILNKFAKNWLASI